MTARELLSSLLSAGCQVFVEPDGGLKLRSPSPRPPVVDGLLEELRGRKAEVAAIIRPCVDCGAAVQGGVFLCADCLEERHERKKVLTFDPTRRRRTEAALAAERCSSCGGTDWRTNERGDSWCESCRLRLLTKIDTMSETLNKTTSQLMADLQAAADERERRGR